MLSHLSRVCLFAILWTVARQAPLSMGILQAGILEWVAMAFYTNVPDISVIPYPVPAFSVLRTPLLAA